MKMWLVYSPHDARAYWYDNEAQALAVTEDRGFGYRCVDLGAVVDALKDAADSLTALDTDTRITLEDMDLWTEVFRARMAAYDALAQFAEPVS